MSAHDLSDAELIRRCRFWRHEKLLQSWLGCGATVFTSTVVAIFVLGGLIYWQDISIADVNDPWWLILISLIVVSMAGLLICLFTMLILYLFMMSMVLARPLRYHKEARERFMPPSSLRMKEIIQQRTRDDPESPWIVGLSAAVLPHGGNVSIVAKKPSDTDDYAVMEIWRCPNIDLGEVDPRRAVCHIRQNVPSHKLATLQELVTSLKSHPLLDVFNRVIDGLPCEVLASLAPHDECQSAKCNLAQRADKPLMPAIALAQTLIALAEEYVDELFIMGSYDPFGDEVRIDRV